MRKLFVVLIMLILAVVLSAGCVQNPDTPLLPLTPTPVPDDYEYYPHAGSIDSEEAYFTGLNEHYNLGLTEDEIQKYANELRNGYLKDAVRDEYNVHINDLVEFHGVVAEMINLDPAIYEEIVTEILSPPEEEHGAPRIPLEPGIVVVEVDLGNVNRIYSLGLTNEEILEIADDIKTGYLKDAERRDGLHEHWEYIFVEDMLGYHTKIADVLNFSQETFEKYIWMLEHPIVY